MLRLVQTPGLTALQRRPAAGPGHKQPALEGLESYDTVRFVQGVNTGDLAAAVSQSRIPASLHVEVYKGVTRVHTTSPGSSAGSPTGSPSGPSPPVTPPSLSRPTTVRESDFAFTDLLAFLPSDTDHTILESKDEVASRNNLEPAHHVFPLFDVLHGVQDLGMVEDRLDYVARRSGGAASVSYTISFEELGILVNNMVFPSQSIELDQRSDLHGHVRGFRNKYYRQLITWHGAPTAQWLVEHLLGRPGSSIEGPPHIFHKFQFPGFHIEHVAFLDQARMHQDRVKLETHDNYATVILPTHVPCEPHMLLFFLSQDTQAPDKGLEPDTGGTPDCNQHHPALEPFVDGAACRFTRVIRALKDDPMDTDACTAAFMLLLQITSAPEDKSWDTFNQTMLATLKTLVWTVLRPAIDQHISWCCPLGGAGVVPLPLQRFRSCA